MTTTAGRVPAKLVVLESYWNRRLFNPVSVRGFLESLAPLLHPPLAVAHRFVESRLVYFAACSVLRGARGRAFARRFLLASGCRAVIGYSKPVDWVESLVVDLLFLKRFYADPQPWRNLARIVASVRRDLPLARRLGWTFVRADARKRGESRKKMR